MIQFCWLAACPARIQWACRLCQINLLSLREVGLTLPLPMLLVRADEAGRDAVARAKEIVIDQGALKRLLSAKSPIAVRSACYSLIAFLSRR